MFQLTILAHGSGFAVALDFTSRNTKRGDGAFRQYASEFFAHIDQEGEVVLIFSCKRIADNADGGSAAQGRHDALPLLRQGFFDESNDLADFRFHRNPSSPLMSLAARPPARA